MRSIANKRTAAEIVDAKKVRQKIPIIGYALMGKLAQGDQTGYELSLIMGPPRNFIWEAKHSQIYTVLAVLAKAGYVTFSQVIQDSRPNKKVYAITDRGREALREWVLHSPTPEPHRHEFAMKVVSLWALSPSEALEVIQNQIAMTNTEIGMIDEHYDEAQKRYQTTFPVPVTSRYFGLYAAIKHARDSKLASIQWYEWIADQLIATLDETQAPVPAAKASPGAQQRVKSRVKKTSVLA